MTTTPEPPYLAVIFTNRRAGLGDTAVDTAYAAAADRMEHLAETIPGYLGIESVRGADGVGVTVSYWADEDAVTRWRNHPEHLDTQARGGPTGTSGTSCEWARRTLATYRRP
ncbi:MAG: antibiotic biosynthesis monooxygenase [Acidimicrobiales bacterium]